MKEGQIKRNKANGEMVGGVSVNWSWSTAIKSLKWIKIRLTVADKNLNLGFLQLLCYSSYFPLKITSTQSIPFKTERHRHHLFSSYNWFERYLPNFYAQINDSCCESVKNIVPFAHARPDLVKEVSLHLWPFLSSATWKATARLGKYLQGGGHGYNNIQRC